MTRLSYIDPLTGLTGPRLAVPMLAQMILDAECVRRSVCICLVGVDSLKHMNDRHGHPSGDQALGAVAAAIDAESRARGWHCLRVGGDKFAVIGAGSDGDCRFGELVRRAVRESSDVRAAIPDGLTISVGIVTVNYPLDDGPVDHPAPDGRHTIIGRTSRSEYTSRR